MAIAAPYDLVSAHPWRQAVFTTYALSLSFFEAVVLDALTRGRGQDATIFADIEGVRAALGEQGARRVGRDYQIEPFVVEKGVFHPKITALSGDDDCHLLVGSGNLTFGGWGGNFEVLEHLHPSFAADAFDDATQFFEQLGSRPGIRHRAQGTCEKISLELRRGAGAAPRHGQVRLLHSLDGAIAEKLANLADGLGGATRLLAASPFWSDGALDRLCEVLRLDHAFIHSHRYKSVRGHFGSNWPFKAKRAVHAVRAEPLLDSDAKRLLHAKVFEVVCKRGRILLSGSANATIAALGSNNVEASVARIQRETLVGWALEKASPPLPEAALPEDAALDDSAGILRAVLTGDQIAADILEPRMSGPAKVFQVTAEGPVELGSVTIDAAGSFHVLAPNLEIQSWKGGRLIVRVEQANGKRAEGFVSVASYPEIRRRVGALAPRLFALLSGTETPGDVAAIMSWFQEDPQRMMARAFPQGAGSDGGDTDTPDVLVSVSDLEPVTPKSFLDLNTHGVSSEASWKRFMDNVFAAFRTKRASFVRPTGDDSDDDDEDVDLPPKEAKVDPAIGKSISVFDRLLDLLLSQENSKSYAMMAFDMAQYVCGRLRPDATQVRNWLHRLVVELGRNGVPADRTADAAEAILLDWAASPERVQDERTVRLRLLYVGCDLTAPFPLADEPRIKGFLDALDVSVDFEDLWSRLRRVRALSEQARAYLNAWKLGIPSDEYPDLPVVAPEAWPTMEAAIHDEDYRNDIIVISQPVRSCPRCHRVLPTGDAAALADIRVVLARDCCRRILVCEGL